MIGLPVPREEMIDCESWYHLVDYHYERGLTDLPTGIVHCDMGSIPEFFNEIRGNKKKYIVVSSRCDFGLHYQQQYPPWQDYGKFANQVLGAQNTNFGYENISLPAPINKKRCNPYDQYSIKCYRYTEATFPSIPDNVVRWFVSNNTILNNGRIITIPFGINGVDGNKQSGDKIFARTSSINHNVVREKNVYANFTFYTNERLKLFQLYSECDFATCESSKDHNDFLDQLSAHNYCLCPPGNGWDCYRTFEAIYMGCIPIVELNPAMLFYTTLNLPIICLDSLESLTYPLIKYLNMSVVSDRSRWDLTKATLSYWKNYIESSRILL